MGCPLGLWQSNDAAFESHGQIGIERLERGVCPIVVLLFQVHPFLKANERPAFREQHGNLLRALQQLEKNEGQKVYKYLLNLDPEKKGLQIGSFEN